MGMFRWAAPLFGHFGDRWSDKTIEMVAEWLEPYLPGPCPERCRILDVGGGTGALANRLNRRLGAQVVVLDPSPHMLRYVPESGAVSCTLGTAEAIPFDDDSFDAVVVTDAFHHFADQDAAVREFSRILRPGGGVLIIDLEPGGAMQLIVALERLLGEPGAFLTREGMCALMSRHGIDGECEMVKRPAYRFLGTAG